MDHVGAWCSDPDSDVTPGCDHVTTSPGPDAGAPCGSHVMVRRGLTKSKCSLAEMVGVVLVLLLTALPAGRWGLEDLSEALTFPSCVTGAALVLVALTMIVGMVAVLDCWARGPISNFGVVALISTGVALLTNGLLLFQTWKDGEKVGYPVFFGLLVLGSLWAVISVWRRLDQIPTPKRVAVALIVTTIVAVANFSYQYLYQPYRRGAAPLVQLSVGKPVLSEDEDGKAFSVPVDIKLVNHSDVSFYVLGAEFHAMGEKVRLNPTDLSQPRWRKDAEEWAKYREKHPLTRREVYQSGELVAAQPWIPAGNWVQENDESLTRIVVKLPIGTPYEKLTFYSSLSLARKDRLVMGSFGQPMYSWRGVNMPRWVKESKGIDTIVKMASMKENNAIDRYTRDQRRVSTYWRFGSHGAEVSVVIARKGEEGREFSEEEIREVQNRYGLLDILTGPVEQTLGEIKSLSRR
ncbi:hypothetical protein [Streptomyces sp. NPDC046727]|uniref:hypothetical protein n=1 Tax=Streptomyces sp. NPDC046727 TaxID=3155373 RepID=UPI0033C009A7